MYEVILPKSVSKQIRKLPPRVRGRVLQRLSELGDEPRPFDGAAYLQCLGPQEVTDGGTMVFRIAVEKQEGTVA